MPEVVDIDILRDKLQAARERLFLNDQDAPHIEPLTLNPVVDEEVLEALEMVHDIRLPEDYRRFLLELGDGGSGPPNDGILPVNEAFAMTRKLIYHLAEPFVPPTCIEDLIDEEAPGILLIGGRGCSCHDGLVVSGSEIGTMWCHIQERPGWVPIADEEQLGKLVGDTSDQRERLALLMSPTNHKIRVSFTRYYEQWLDRLLRG